MLLAIMFLFIVIMGLVLSGRWINFKYIFMFIAILIALMICVEGKWLHHFYAEIEQGHFIIVDKNEQDNIAITKKGANQVNVVFYDKEEQDFDTQDAYIYINRNSKKPIMLEVKADTAWKRFLMSYVHLNVLEINPAQYKYIETHDFLNISGSSSMVE